MKKGKFCYLWLEFIDSEIGGAVTHMDGLLSSIEKQKFFVASSGNYKYLKNYNMIDLQLKSRFDIIFKLNFWGYKKLKKIIRNQNPSAIYQRHVNYTDFGCRIARDLNIPFYLEYNGPLTWVTKKWTHNPIKKRIAYALSPLSKYYENKVLKGADKIFVVSETLRKELLEKGIEKERLVLNPNGVDTKKFNPKISGKKIRKKLRLPESSVVVGFLSTFDLWHGAEIIAKTANEMADEEKNIYFIFMGDGRLRKESERISGNNEKIKFTSSIPRNNVPEYLAACDILVNPTIPNSDRTEFFGSPTKLFEYMAMGKAIVSSNIGQMKEMLDDTKDSVLVEAGDYKELKYAILTLAKDEKLRKNLGREARKKVVKEYTWKKNAERVLRHYEN